MKEFQDTSYNWQYSWSSSRRLGARWPPAGGGSRVGGTAAVSSCRWHRKGEEGMASTDWQLATTRRCHWQSAVASGNCPQMLPAVSATRGDCPQTSPATSADCRECTASLKGCACTPVHVANASQHSFVTGYIATFSPLGLERCNFQQSTKSSNTSTRVLQGQFTCIKNSLSININLFSEWRTILLGTTRVATLKLLFHFNSGFCNLCLLD